MSKFRWFTNGEITIKVYENQEVPHGYHKGRTFNTNPWNKGLTKDNSEAVRKLTDKRNATLKEHPHTSWNKGLTKETNASLQRVSQKVSKARKGKAPWNKGIPMREESKKKLSDKNKGKNSWCKGLTKDSDSRLQSISNKLTGHPYWTKDSDKAKEKEYITKRKNNSFNSSKAEIQLQKKLVEVFGKCDVVRQYFDRERYPFKCDFYIKSIDLFIELH